MSKRIVSILTCNICGEESKTSDHTLDWVEFSKDVEGWKEYDICPSCIEIIDSTRELHVNTNSVLDRQE